MIETLLQASLLIGFTIIASLFYLSKQSEKLEQNLTSLIKFNDENNYDTLMLVKKSWPYFKKAGYIGFNCDLNWFGTRINYSYGVSSNYEVSFQEDLEDIRVKIIAYKSKHVGEKHYFDNLFWQSYILLLKMDLLIKINTIFSTEHQLQKYNTFILHDVKNIAQFIVTIDAQLNKKTNIHKLTTLLENVVPSVKVRAERIIHTLSQKKPEAYRPVLTRINLPEKIISIAQIHALNVEVKGQGTIFCDEEKMDQVIDNILNNYNHHSDIHDGDATDTVFIKIENQSKSVKIVFYNHQKVKSYNHQRLFEPFWSSTKHGMGIGMYQCQILLRTMGGTLEANIQKNNTLKFVIKIIKNEEENKKK